MPKTSSAPNWAAAMERIPDPVPTSRTERPLFLSLFSKDSIQSFVVAWVPVPKAIPGVISIGISPLFNRILAQGGFTTNLDPTRRGLKNLFQFSPQSCSGMEAASISMCGSFGLISWRDFKYRRSDRTAFCSPPS